MSFKKQPKGYASKAIHAGYQPEDSKCLAVAPPIVTSSTFKQTDPGSGKVNIEELIKDNSFSTENFRATYTLVMITPLEYISIRF